jgi:MFS superfamily sulfate permease-like transporter
VIDLVFQGPTALLALLTSAFLPHRASANAAAYAVILAFFCGIFQLLMGILNLGDCDLPFRFYLFIYFPRCHFQASS